MSDKKLTTIALQLVRYHYDKDDVRFNESCKELEQWYFNHDKQELADFVCACRCPEFSFVPM